MTVVIYRSSDASAPQLSGTAGDLIAVLDGCLVNGYGAKSAAGWAKSFTATNKGVYRQGTGSLLGYLDVDDSGPGGGGAKEARMRAYDVMTAIATGTNPFPTVAQQANGLVIRKSVTADATARPWIIIADHRTFYMFVLTGDTAGVHYCWMFGEYYTYKTSDLGRNIIIGRTTAAENNATTSSSFDGFDQSGYVGGSVAGHYLNRDVTGAAGAITAAKLADWELTNNGTASMIGILQFTNPADQRIYLAPIRVSCTSPANTLRGRMRGIWFYGHPITTVSNGDTFSGVGELAGKTFEIIKQTGNACVICMETSSTWDTN